MKGNKNEKTFVIALLCALIMMVNIPANAVVDPSYNYVYQTSYGNSFSLSDYDIYLEDFENTEFASSQDVIDYVYQVGYARANARSGQIQVGDYLLTEGEIELLINNFLMSSIAFATYRAVISKVQTLYPDTYHVDGSISNSFKHAYWTMMLSKYTNESFAFSFVSAHEEYDGNPELHKNMDLFNNGVAHDYFMANNMNFSSHTDAEIANIVNSMISNGDLIYVVFNYEYVSKITYYEATGLTVKQYSTGNFYAYTNSTVPYNVPLPFRITIPADPDLPVLTPQSKKNNTNV